VGCGGLGGYVIEMLARIGIGHLVCIDGDCFDESNLNRQLYATEANIGHGKAQAAMKRLAQVNTEVKVTIFEEQLGEDNGHQLLSGCDIIIDAVDNVVSKLLLERFAFEEKIALVHGAIGGWYGQVTTIMPGNWTLEKLYKRSRQGIEKSLGNPSFTPATIASIQVAECLKVLLNKEGCLENKILMVDLLNHDYEIIEL
jgi:molybdopterin/thiamine biosynthesis adenylyltransferase